MSRLEHVGRRQGQTHRNLIDVNTERAARESKQSEGTVPCPSRSTGSSVDFCRGMTVGFVAVVVAVAVVIFVSFSRPKP